MGRGWKRAQSAPRQSLTRQLFFKALKQGLKIRTFVGTSENAVQIQIWTALIAMLILNS
jgi:IS4 transposase